jgi:hypothetical protein
MGNPQIFTFQMTQEGDKYIFRFEDGYYAESMEGTLKEIAYVMFEGLMKSPKDGTFGGADFRFYARAPFWVSDRNASGFVISIDPLSEIEPKPNQAFWDELNEQFRRLMKLIIFS